MTFHEMQQQAAEKGCKLERAADSRLIVKTGYIIWRDGIWTRLATLQQVAQYLSRL